MLAVDKTFGEGRGNALDAGGTGLIYMENNGEGLCLLA